MPKIRPPSRSSVAFAAGLALSGAAGALGIGELPSSAVLGQALDFSVEVRLEPGETLEPSCIGAEVTIGERRLPGAATRSAITRQTTNSAVVRVATIVPIDEPVVEVSLGVGCNARITRRFVLFADPPPVTPIAAALPAVAPVVPPAAPAAIVAPRAASAPSEGPSSTPQPARPAAAATAADTPRRSEPRRAAAAAPSPAAAPARAAAAAPMRATAARPTPARPAAAPAREAPRLRVDVMEPASRQAVAPSAAVVEEAIAAVQAAASAARAAADAASQSAARIRALEQDVARLQRESRAREAEAADLRQRVAAAERASDLTTPLLLAAFALLALAGWLAWRLRSLQAERERNWREAADAAVSALGPESAGPPTGTSSQQSRLQSGFEPAPSVSAPASRGDGGTAGAPSRTQPDEIDLFATGSPALMSGPPTLPAEPITERTLVLPVPGAESARDVSIEELIDLEQQADFFAVLGQDEAAIDLLVEHLRQSGGGSPLPYLKLLEIHRRRDERREYERIRDRFNNRFNAYAPDWDTDLQHGRALEDYAGVLPRLQAVWPRPLDAMAELEALLFRRSRGELFDLPAYRDVLMLYAVARDLNERDGGTAGDVDLLLPLADGGEFSSTAATPLQFPELRRAPPPSAGGIDLDLSDSTGERGIFIDSQRGRPS